MVVHFQNAVAIKGSWNDTATKTEKNYTTDLGFDLFKTTLWNVGWLTKARNVIFSDINLNDWSDAAISVFCSNVSAPLVPLWTYSSFE